MDSKATLYPNDNLVVMADEETLTNPKHQPEALSALPDELLAEIFSYRCAGPDDYPDMNVIQPNPIRARAPFVVSAVNRQWRTAALATSRLWHCVLIPNLTRSEDPVHEGHARDKCLQYLNVVLPRSRSGPIDIIFVFIDANLQRPTAAAVYPPVLDLLRQHQPRWRRFIARVLGIPAIRVVLRGLVGPTPMLRTVQILQQRSETMWGYAADTFAWSDRLEEEFKELPAILEDAPKLIWASMVNIPFLVRWLAVTIKSPLCLPHGLEYITPGQYDPELWEVLRRSPQFHQLALGTTSAQHPPNSTPDAPYPIVLPAVTRIWFSQNAYQLLVDHPYALRFPQLDTLTMMYGEFCGLETWLQSVQNTLSFIDLHNVSNLAGLDIDVLAALPNITNLSIGEAIDSVPDAWLERIGRVPVEVNGAVMWPKLCWLTLYSNTIEHVERGRLVDIARMRSRPRSAESQGENLRWAVLEMDVNSDNKIPQEQLDEIAALQKERVETTTA